MDLKISQLTIGTLTTGDWLPTERDASSNYRLNLRESITGALSDSYGTVRIGANAVTGIGASNVIAIGNNAGQRTSGSDSVFIGENSGSGITIGAFNVFIGDGAASNAVTSANNVVIGRNAGKSINPGSNCVLIGAGAITNDEDDNSIVIGYNNTGGGSNTVVLGNSSIQTTILRGDVSAASFTSDSSTINDILYLGGATRSLQWNSSSPNGAQVASKGSLFLRTDGDYNGLYVKETGSDAYGWQSVATKDSNDFLNCAGYQLNYSNFAYNSGNLTLSNSYNGKTIISTNTGAITYTIASGLSTGFFCGIVQYNSGSVSIAGAAGVSSNSFMGSNMIAGRYGTIFVNWVQNNSYLLRGDVLDLNNYSLLE